MTEHPHGNLVEDKRIPREHKTYLGDGLYAVHYAGSIWLQAYDGVRVSNSVALDDVVLANLFKFAGVG